MITYNLSIRQRIQRKCVLNEPPINNGFVYRSCSLRKMLVDKMLEVK